MVSKLSRFAAALDWLQPAQLNMHMDDIVYCLYIICVGLSGETKAAALELYLMLKVWVSIKSWLCSRAESSYNFPEFQEFINSS